MKGLEKYRLTINSGNKNDLGVHIEDKIVKFSANDDGIYPSKRDKIVFRKLYEENKRNIV